MKIILGYERTRCTSCQGTGQTTRAIWGYPPGLEPLQAVKYPLRYWRVLRRWVDQFAARHEVACSNYAFSRRLWASTHGYGTGDRAGQRFDSFAKAMLTIASLRAAEEFGWTPATERQFERAFPWFNAELRK